MIEIKSLPGGRYEVVAEGLHREAFEGTFGAIVVAEALTGELSKTTHAPVTVAAPWGEHRVSEADESADMASQPR